MAKDIDAFLSAGLTLSIVGGMLCALGACDD